MTAAQAEWIRSAITRYEAPLVRYAISITGDLERARDVVQDTFVKLCSQSPSRIQEHLAQWLYTVCRNRALDIRKKEKRMSPLSDTQLGTKFSTSNTPFGALESKEELGRVLKVLDTLPERQREVIRLKFQHELSYREISQVTNISITNVGFLLHTGLKTVREKLNAQSGVMGLRRVR